MAPVIDNVTIAKEADGEDTKVILTIDVTSNVPMMPSFQGQLIGPNEHVWGSGGFMGETWTEVTANKWRFIHTDMVSQYTPSGEYRYMGIKVQGMSPAALLESTPWVGELKVTITNSIVPEVPVIDNITLTSIEQNQWGSIVGNFTIDITSNVPLLELNINNGTFILFESFDITQPEPGKWRLILPWDIMPSFLYSPGPYTFHNQYRIENAGGLLSEWWNGEFTVNIP